ncbi:hypothetical protein Kfla_3306 [Kribbella flavida DSM 17836]|uniref:Uncharacterized protein n=1 Tax=Kribbella flavida (strain DSM 17836 / JCM 10339 / NBRC 14399) TaxID=479435 RepID=D2PKQ0_KRIFD|nr:hypothetical protein [Kribbella flavida]ADB32367.1 hypothetical protein Kfla_3306 [Kribbella flavida DSM 17836]
MIKFALVLGAGYTGFKLAYHSEDGVHYGKVGEQALRRGLSLFFAALAGGLAYAALVLH